MNKRRAALAIALAVILIVIAFLFLLTRMTGDSEKASSAPAAAGGPEVTLRNTTRASVSFTLKPEDSAAEPKTRRLDAGEFIRIPASGSMVLTYRERIMELTYVLAPGKHYAFRSGENGKIEFWAGSHGVEGADDLAPFISTPSDVVAKMLELAEVDADDVVFDLGCGDGRIVIAAAKDRGARGVGIDIEPERISESRENAARAGVEDLVEFRCEDVLRADLAAATAVTVYLLPRSLALLRPKLEQELAPGTPVVSHDYSIPGWETRRVREFKMTASDGREHTILLYRK
jgi:hypothetical protein